jgi:hypothetical protein
MQHGTAASSEGIKSQRRRGSSIGSDLTVSSGPPWPEHKTCHVCRERQGEHISYTHTWICYVCRLLPDHLYHTRTRMGAKYNLSVDVMIACYMMAKGRDPPLKLEEYSPEDTAAIGKLVAAGWRGPFEMHTLPNPRRGAALMRILRNKDVHRVAAIVHGRDAAKEMVKAYNREYRDEMLARSRYRRAPPFTRKTADDDGDISP